MTYGATDGIERAMFLVPPAAPVFVQDPTYFIALDMFTKKYKRRVLPSMCLNMY